MALVKNDQFSVTRALLMFWTNYRQYSLEMGTRRWTQLSNYVSQEITDQTAFFVRSFRHTPTELEFPFNKRGTITALTFTRCQCGTAEVTIRRRNEREQAVSSHPCLCVSFAFKDFDLSSAFRSLLPSYFAFVLQTHFFTLSITGSSTRSLAATCPPP